jgi:Heterokaryon incompatibility protein (HET)
MEWEPTNRDLPTLLNPQSSRPSNRSDLRYQNEATMHLEPDSPAQRSDKQVFRDTHMGDLKAPKFVPNWPQSAYALQELGLLDIGSATETQFEVLNQRKRHPEHGNPQVEHRLEDIDDSTVEYNWKRKKLSTMPHLNQLEGSQTQSVGDFGSRNSSSRSEDRTSSHRDMGGTSNDSKRAQTIVSKSGRILYWDLPHADSIRILCIEPGIGTKLDCSLVATTLSNWETPFEAISYDRSELSEKVTIHISDTSFEVDRNLCQALVALRYNDKPRYVWVDAISINQEDDKERGHQLRLMRQIYKIADKVIIYLGHDTKNRSNLAFSVICSVASGGMHDGQPIGQANFYVDGMSSASMPDIPCRDGPPPANFKVFWSAVQELFSHGWFWRIWSLQAISKARTAEVVWGKSSISWAHIGLAAARLCTIHDEILQKHSMPGVFNAYLMYRMSQASSAPLPLALSFARLLASTREFKCIEPRDRIYGLLGITTTDTSPDKGEFFIDTHYERSVEDLYINVAKKIITTERNLSPLASVQHGSQLPDNSPLPSWVPNWTSFTTQPLSPAIPGPSAAPLSQEYQYKLYISPSNELIVSGLIYNTIATVFDEYTPSTTPSSYIANIPSWHDHLSSPQTIHHIAMTLSAGKEWYGIPVQNVSSHIADFAACLSQSGLIQDLSTANGSNERFTQAAKNPCTGRRAFSLTTSASGMDLWPYGIGPVAMQPGDAVCVLFGFDLPVVLRCVEGEYFRFVGECYVYDLMDGRVVTVPGQGHGSGTFTII